MKKRIISMLLIMSIILTNIFIYAEVKKDETVYAKLRYDGSVEEIRVVNHLYGSGNADSYTDFGQYSQIKNMTGNVEPKINGDEIIWPMELLKDKDIYYEGVISKELPIGIGIKYYLDGKDIAAVALGGKSGRLKIEISVKHSKNIDWDKTNLITQIQLTPDLDVFKNIETEGNSIVVGKKANITFIALPPTDQSFTFEADGENIYLDAINVTLVPSSFELPGDLQGSMDKLTDGLDEMDKGSTKLATGAGELAQGTGQLKDGMVKLDSGIGKLYSGANELSKNSQEISVGMEQFGSGLKQMAGQGSQLIDGLGQMTAGMDTLAQKGNEMQAGIGQLHGGMQQANGGVKELSAGLDQLTIGHSQLMQLARMYINSSDPMLRRLAEGIIQEGEGLQKLNAGLQESSKGLDTLADSTGQLNAGFGEYNSGVTKLAGGIKELQQGAGVLPQALQQLSDSFEALKKGINKYFGGVIEISKALRMMKENTKALPSNIDKLVKGQNALKDGVLSLDKGIKEMSSGIKGNMSGALTGKGGDSYTSFVDNEKNKNSTVQFIMRTPSIDRPEVKDEFVKPTEQKKGFLERLLDLFRRK